MNTFCNLMPHMFLLNSSLLQHRHPSTLVGAVRVQCQINQCLLWSTASELWYTMGRQYLRSLKKICVRSSFISQNRTEHFWWHLNVFFLYKYDNHNNYLWIGSLLYLTIVEHKGKKRNQCTKMSRQSQSKRKRIRKKNPFWSLDLFDLSEPQA